MSSFPQHNENVLALKKLGFDMEEYMEAGEATMSSWGYDELVDILATVIRAMEGKSLKYSKLLKQVMTSYEFAAWVADKEGYETNYDQDKILVDLLLGELNHKGV